MFYAPLGADQHTPPQKLRSRGRCQRSYPPSSLISPACCSSSYAPAQETTRGFPSARTRTAESPSLSPPPPPSPPSGSQPPATTCTWTLLGCCSLSRKPLYFVSECQLATFVIRNRPSAAACCNQSHLTSILRHDLTHLDVKDFAPLESVAISTTKSPIAIAKLRRRGLQPQCS